MKSIELDFEVTGKDLLRLTALFKDEIGTSLLYSGGQSDSSNHSFLWLFPYDSFSVSSHNTFSHGTEETRWDVGDKKSWSFLDEQLTVDEKWIGYLTYEMGLNSDFDCKISGKKGKLPLAYFQKTKIILKVNHKTDRCEIFYHSDISLKEQAYFDAFGKRSFWEELKDPTPSPLQIFNVDLEDRDSYFRKFADIQEWIRKGDLYQVNLSHEMKIEGLFSPFDLFYRLGENNPSSFAAFFHFQDFSIISSSPERLLLHSAGALETRPIKGTAPRGKEEEQDKKNREYLLHSEKEKAELLMITDLARNDLGKVSEVSSVHVPCMFSVDAYSNVFHMHSKVISQGRKELSPVSYLRAVFPGGSITGCPKLKAQEVIAELEDRPREIYTGSIGYFWEGEFDFNIAIRTILLYQNTLSLQLGGAIVADSDSEKKYEETLHKGASVFQTLGI